MQMALGMLLAIGVISALIFGIRIINKWDRSLSEPKTLLKTHGKMGAIHLIRQKTIFLTLGFVWVLTLLSGLLGIWKQVTGPLLISISTMLTVFCITSLKRKRYCNKCVGSSFLYCGYLCLFSAYKIGYWHFAMSVWWLVYLTITYVLISLLSLWLFIKNGKQANRTGKTSKKSTLSFSALGISLAIYPVIILIRNSMRDNSVGNDIAIPILMTCLLVFLVPYSFGIRYFLIDDSELLYSPNFN